MHDTLRRVRRFLGWGAAVLFVVGSTAGAGLAGQDTGVLNVTPPGTATMATKAADAPGAVVKTAEGTPDEAMKRSVLQGMAAGSQPGTDCVPVRSRISLYNLGSIDSFDITQGGVKAAKTFIEYFNTGDTKFAHEALEMYEKLIPKENFGGEYTALQWFLEYITGSEDTRKEMLADPYHAFYFHYFADNDWAVLKEYLKLKYSVAEVAAEKQKKKDQEEPQDPKALLERTAFLEDLILFNNPRRERWEKTSKILSVLNIKEGERVIDIGSGPGYYSYFFSQMVGPSGQVYAVDIKKSHIDYMDKITEQLNIKNISRVQAATDNIKVEDKVDVAFMCSLYHIVYGYMAEPTRRGFLDSIIKTLKKDGRLVIVDNDLVEDTTMPYHGPYIVRELIISQLAFYGFELVEEHQFIPQRYVLVFKLKEGAN